MFGGRKKLYAKGAQTEGYVTKAVYDDYNAGYYRVDVGVKFPDGATRELHNVHLVRAFHGEVSQGGMVPVRYDPGDHSKVVVDKPVLEERQVQAKAAQQAQAEKQFASFQPGAPRAPGGPAAQLLAGLGGEGDLRERVLQMAAQSPGSVVNLSSSSPAADSGSDPVDRLSKLAELKQQGVLTEEEFTAAKAKILAES